MSAANKSNNNSNKRAAPSEIVALGLAQKTKKSRSSAWERFEEFQRQRDEDLFVELTSFQDDEVKCDVVKERLITFAQWLIDNPLEKKTKPGESVGASSVMQYFGQVKEEIKEQTSTLDIWTEKEESVWYTQLRSNLETGVMRKVGRGEDEYKDPSCRALHIDCSVGKLRATDRHFLGKLGVDLQTIVKNIIHTSRVKQSAYRDRTQLLLTFYGVGRGGETKFLKWNEFSWDDYFQNLEGVWTRMKTLLKQVVSFQCCRLGYLCDLYHSFGCYFAVDEDGLFRHDLTDDNPMKRRNKFIFPHLWTTSDATVAKNLTTLIRDNSDECFKVVNQSRSIRAGANTELAMHPHISPEQQRLAGGFAAGNCSELYTRMNPDLCLPAANTLAQWPLPLKRVYPPSLECIVAAKTILADEVEALTNYLYLIKVDESQQNGKLRPFLNTCTASLIMYFPDMLHDFGRQNAVVVKIMESVVKLKKLATNQDAIVVLAEWSRLVKADYDAKNCLLDDSTEATMLQTIQAQSVLINELIIGYRDLAKKNLSLETEVMRLNATVADLPRMLVAPLVSALAATMAQAQVEAPTMSPTGDGSSLAPASQIPATVATTIVAAGRDPAVASVMQPGCAPPPDDPNELVASLPDDLLRIIDQFRQSLEQADEANRKTVLKWKDLPANDSNKGLFVREVIEAMVKEDLISASSTQLVLANHEKQKMPMRIQPKNSGHFRATMKVVDMVLTDEQKQLLLTQKKQRDAIGDFSNILRIACYAIEQATFAKMEELDGQSRSTKATVLAIGRRYADYCKANNIPIEPVSDAGQTSVKDYFGTRGRTT